MKRVNCDAARSVVELAHGILDLHLMVSEQAAEIERLREYERKYHELMDSSLEHARAMAGNQLLLCLDMLERRDETR